MSTDNTVETTISKDAQNRATIAQLSAFVMFVGVRSLVGPLIVWLAKKDDPYVEAHAKEALNFNISYLLYAIIAGISVFLLIGLPALPAVFVAWFVLVILAAVRPLTAAATATRSPLSSSSEMGSGITMKRTLLMVALIALAACGGEITNATTTTTIPDAAQVPPADAIDVTITGVDLSSDQVTIRGEAPTPCNELGSTITPGDTIEILVWAEPLGPDETCAQVIEPFEMTLGFETPDTETPVTVNGEEIGRVG